MSRFQFGGLPLGIYRNCSTKDSREEKEEGK
jgi:hypothetical protein